MASETRVQDLPQGVVAQEHLGDVEADGPSEETPLLPPRPGAQEDGEDQTSTTKKPRRRWPSLIALVLLILGGILILILAFVAPDIVKEYAEQAVVFEPESLSIDSFTATGVRARVQGNFRLDPARVEKEPVRNLGRFFTWIVAAVESGESEVEISLPEYGNVVLGSAHVPAITVGIRAGEWTHLDFLADVEPGNVDGIRSIANDWIEGRLGQLRFVGKASVPLKSGIISLGEQEVQHEVIFSGDDVPAMPGYEIESLKFEEVELPTGKAMVADATISASNDYPVDFTVPPLAFGILVDACAKNDPAIMVADALTKEIHVRPREKIIARVTGTVQRLPPVLIRDCPGSGKSPLDKLVGKYIHGNDTTIYVQGADSPSPETPEWISQLLKSLTVPVPVPGHSLGHLIKNFSMTDTHFGLPDPWADPDSPESKPQISAKVKALVPLPKEVNVNLDVSRVRANADVLYKGKKFGELDMHKWQPANSTRLEAPPHKLKHTRPDKPDSGDDDDEEDGPMMLIESLVDKAPLTITDEDGFSSVLGKLVFGEPVEMTVQATVDVEVETALGVVMVRNIPAEGKVPVKPFTPTTFQQEIAEEATTTRPLPPINTSLLAPRIKDLRVAASTPASLLLAALFDVTNPTEYSASVPYFAVQIWSAGHLLGWVKAERVEVGRGRVRGVGARVAYEPLAAAAAGGNGGKKHPGKEGEKARAEGRRLLGQFVSGAKDLRIGVRGWEGSFAPLGGNGRAANQSSMTAILGRALARLGTFDIPIPAIGAKIPGQGNDDGGDDDNDDDDAPHFLKDATFHLFSSSATFVLLNPLPHDSITLTRLNATALYPHAAPKEPDDEEPGDPDDDPWSTTTTTVRTSRSRSRSDNSTILDPIGHIFYTEPIVIPPLAETPDGEGFLTPKLPVEWSLGSVGYEAVRKALGGKLRLGARAEVDVRIGEFEEVDVVFQRGGGIGAHVRL